MVALAAVLLATAVAPAQVLPTTPLTIQSGETVHEFVVEIADDSAERSRGLMFRKEMAPDAGMLFIFPGNQPVAFWMKNTYIPLDMLFIDRTGRIVNIHERAVPRSLETIHSKGPVRAVLELNGGTAARLAIKPGDTVRHAAFGNDE